MAKVKMTAEITEHSQLTAGIFDMKVRAPQIADQAVPGQFVSLYSQDGAKLLPRPISLCGIHREKGELRLVYRVAGAGTREFSRLHIGDRIEVLGPLGNGFPVKQARKALLIGGGIGIPPMLELARALSWANRGGSDSNKRGMVQIILGYRDRQMFLKDEFEPFGPVYVATEDGSVGTRGNVLDVIRQQGLEGEILYACGPTPMLRALKAYGTERSIECWLSLEEKMACGIGACLACVCQSKSIDPHSQVNNKRVCKDGPVFLADEIEL